MRKLFDRLKLQPWRSLVQAAALTVLLLELPIDGLLQLVIRYHEQSPILANLAGILAVPLVLGLGLPVALGAFAVYVLERVDRFSISTGSLWYLVLCVALVLSLEQWLLFGAPGFTMTELVLIAVGSFGKAAPIGIQIGAGSWLHDLSSALDPRSLYLLLLMTEVDRLSLLD